MANCRRTRRSTSTKAARNTGHFNRCASVRQPSVKNANWVRTPVDAFILKKLEDAGLQPAPPADPATLLRRVYFDLIGLPPTPAEQQAFLRDPSPAAYEKVVDDLLQRPQYGERWGRHWLDVARYAESLGYEYDEHSRLLAGVIAIGSSMLSTRTCPTINS